MTINQLPLHTEQLNAEGFPLLLLHGWGQSLESVKPLGQLLTDHSHVHLVDLPGFGKTSSPEYPWSGFDYADRLIQYLDQQGIAKVDLAGHSFGGKVALCLSIRYPERIRRLVLISSSGIPKKRNLFQRLRSMAIKWGGKSLKLIDKVCQTETFANYFAPRFGSVDYRNASGVMRSVLVKTVNEDLSAQVRQVKAPTLLLWGDKDTETPFEIALRLKKLIPNASLLPLHHKGHYPFEGVGAHLCGYHMKQFLRDING